MHFRVYRWRFVVFAFLYTLIQGFYFGKKVTLSFRLKNLRYGSIKAPNNSHVDITLLTSSNDSSLVPSQNVTSTFGLSISINGTGSPNGIFQNDRSDDDSVLRGIDTILVAVTAGDRTLLTSSSSSSTTSNLAPNKNVAFIIDIHRLAQTEEEVESIKGFIARAQQTIKSLLRQQNEPSRSPQIMATFLFSLPSPAISHEFYAWLASENASDIFVSNEIPNLPRYANERLLTISCNCLSPSSLIKSSLPSPLLSSFDLILSLRPTSKETLSKLITSTIVREIVHQLDSTTTFFATFDIHNGNTLWNPSSSTNNDELLGKLQSKRLTAESNAIVIPKNARTESELVPFSLTFFGGSHLKVANLCHHIDNLFSLNNTVKASVLSLSSLDHVTLSTVLQRFLNNVAQPSHIMSSSFLYQSPSMLPRAYASTPLVKYDEVEVKQYVKLRRAIVESDRRIRAVKLIIDRIKSRYFKSVAAALFKYESNNHKLVKKFLAFTCESWMGCGGMGDRLRGVASLFYSAIATQRIFHMDWEKPVNLDHFFQINHDWYQVPEKLYRTQRQVAHRKARLHVRVDEGGDVLVAQIRGNRTFARLFDRYASVDILTNRFMAIEATFQNPYFLPILADIFPELNNIKPGDVIDYSVPIAAAYRIIFGSPHENMTRLMSSIIKNSVGMAKWQDSLKIGIQIRKCQSLWNDGCSRVEQRHFTCFIDKLKFIAAAMRAGPEQTVSVYVTSDDIGAVDYFKNALANETTFVVFSTASPGNSAPHNFNVKHIDRSSVSLHPTLAWYEIAKVYVDWLLLSKTDFLVISQSGFGQTAAFHSLKPTWQFQHWLVSPQNPCPFYDFIASATKFDFR